MQKKKQAASKPAAAKKDEASDDDDKPIVKVHSFAVNEPTPHLCAHETRSKGKKSPAASKVHTPCSHSLHLLSLYATLTPLRLLLIRGKGSDTCFSHEGEEGGRWKR
jgi:hypothetical protein